MRLQSDVVMQATVLIWIVMAMGLGANDDKSFLKTENFERR